MNIADRIQHLRKTRGISQEELADKIGVSRQSVSKWESEQSSPDIEKIVLMSDFFDVTTDYILKGIEPVPSEVKQREEKPNAMIFTFSATAFNLLGLIVSATVWYSEVTPIATAIGLIFMVMGCMVYRIGMTVGDESTKAASKRSFWSVNIWALAFIPLSLIYNFFFGIFPAPYPELSMNNILWFVLFWIVYIAACLSIIRLIRNSEKIN